MQTIPFPDPGRADTRSPGRLLLWIGLRQWRTQLAGLVLGVVWMLAIALVPAVVGRGIDEGIVAGDPQALVRWSLAILGLGVVAAAAGATRHFLAVHNWLYASYRSAQLTARGIEEAGPALTRALPAGEVIAVFANDVMRIGGLFDVMARFTGALVSYLVVGAILLAASPPLGWLVLLGGPVMLALLTFVVRPLQRRQAEQREQTGRLTTLGADTVAGLRVLRGIGGEHTFLRRYAEQSQRVRASGVRVAGVQAALDSSQVLIPGVFVVLVTWAGARFALDGRITAGQLVAFYGYAAFLTMPLRTVTEFVDRFVRAHIGATKVLRILAVRPDQEPADTSAPAGGGSPAPAAAPGADAVLHDPVSGLVVRPGVLTALVSARPEESAAVADRLGRFGRGDHGVTWGGRPLADLPLAEVRERIVVSEADPRLFTGVLREQLTARHEYASDAPVLEALHTASALDVLEAVPDGLDGLVEERGRSYSGGQRQRLALARALLTEAEVLVLVEPTSAVDAHTEARIAQRLAAAREGRTTVVTTASPLLLGVADEVALVESGRVTATGTHHELLAGHAAYREIVTRGEAD
jgi:ABC-type multidrug transport system fused ATPase/permease subunit